MQSSLKLLAGAGKKVKKVSRTGGVAKRGAVSSGAPKAAATTTTTVAASTAPAASAGFSSSDRKSSSSTPIRTKKDMSGKLSFDASKAGLQKVDKAYVQRVIEESSKGTPFYLKEQRREEERRKRTELMLQKAEEFAEISDDAFRGVQQRVDAMEAEMEAGRDLRRRYIHVDMDMFYAAVEEKKNSRLKDVPFGVGNQAMLSTTNYIARQYGVRSGMPGFIGKKLCPELLIVPVDIRAYRREAAAIHSIASRYDVEFVSVGLDELTMDVTKYLEEYPEKTAAEIAEEFRAEILLKTRLTASAGIAPTTTLAKIASNVNKPNGQHEVVLQSRQEVLDYVKDVPLRKIPGIGYAQEALLNALGIKTCGDLLTHKYLLGYLFKEKSLRHYLATGLGVIETHAHRTTDLRQSVGKESSFSEPLPSRDALQKLFRRLLEFCHMRCVREHLNAEQMVLVLKTRGYDVANYSVSLPKPTNDLKLWLEAAQKLLTPHLDKFDEYRLVGIRMRKLTLLPVLPTTATTTRAAASTATETKRLSQSRNADDGDEDAMDDAYGRNDADERHTRDDDDDDADRDGEDDEEESQAPTKMASKRGTASGARRRQVTDVSDDPYEGYQDDEGASLKLLHRDGTRAVPLPKRPVATTRPHDEDEENGLVRVKTDSVPRRGKSSAPVEKLKGAKLAAYKAMYEADDDDMDIDLDDDAHTPADEEAEHDDEEESSVRSHKAARGSPVPQSKRPSSPARSTPASIPLSKPLHYGASRPSRYAEEESDDVDLNDDDDEEEVIVDAPPKVIKTQPARKTIKKGASASRPSRR